MMIEFMILGLPRTATTWAANWLTTDTTICLHDPLNNWHYSELDALESRKVIGVSCTGLFRFTDWLNNHPARKVIIHRPIEQINADLRRMGLPDVTKKCAFDLGRIKGTHHDWRDIFDNPAPIYEFLLQRPFDQERHAELKQIEMQPAFAGLSYNPEAIKRLIAEFQR